MRGRSRSDPAVTCAVTVGGLLLSGCAALSPDTGTAAGTATDFLAAVTAQDGEAACGLLAPGAMEALVDEKGTACEQAVLDPEVTDAVGSGDPTEGAEAFGRQAQVRFSDDVVFLTRDGDSWVVTAAGCTSRGEEPYDCVIDGS